MQKIDKIGLLALNNGKFLINRKYGSKLFLMPGGRLEENESVEECLIREIKEEHDCKLLPGIKFFGRFEDIAANEPDAIVSMRVYVGDLIGELKSNSEIEEFKWFGRSDDLSILSPIIKNKIFSEIVKQNLIW